MQLNSERGVVAMAPVLIEASVFTALYPVRQALLFGPARSQLSAVVCALYCGGCVRKGRDPVAVSAKEGRGGDFSENLMRSSLCSSDFQEAYVTFRSVLYSGVDY